ncbi:hypothetical protein GCM10018785_50500 [Streptomyces longispororuber]|uniref:Uncharacterized protein n=1 Tax=Streptomyces longispororuber TaxID=68230 RepID=A0A918ZYM1_9ACTN|nr:hypothetical protein GCM10018785_50500 [Streptomyces longispororuber]
MGDRGDEVDEVPAGTVGRGHFPAEGAVVRRRRHDRSEIEAEREAEGETLQDTSPAVFATGSLDIAGLGLLHATSPGTATVRAVAVKAMASTERSIAGNMVGFVLTW